MTDKSLPSFEPRVCSLCRDVVMYCKCSYEDKVRERLEAFESKPSPKPDTQSGE